MRKTAKLLITLILVLLMLVGFSLTASADNAGKVVYENNFSGDKPDDTMWYVNQGSVEIIEEFGDKFLRCYPLTSGTRACRVNFGPDEVQNVDITFKLRARATQTASDAYCGIYFRSISIPSNPLFAYQLRFSEKKTSLVHMNNHYDTTTTTITEDVENIIKPGLWYNIKVALRGDRIVVYVNGKKIMDMDSDLYSQIGGAGICGVRYTFDMDDIVMTQYGGKKLPEPTPNEAPEWLGKEGTEEEEEIADTGNERLNLFGGTTEKVDTAVNFLDPAAWTVGKIIAVVMAGLTVMAAITTIVLLVLLLKKKNKKTITEEVPQE